MKHKHKTSLRTLIRVSVKCCNLFKSPECSSTYFFACLQKKRIRCWANACQGSHTQRITPQTQDVTYLRTSNFSSMVHGFDRMPSIMSRCIWMFSNTSPVIGSSVDNFLWVSLQLQANKKDISIKRISGTEGACYLSSYCMSYFTIIFYYPFYFKGRIKSNISPFNLTRVFIITFYLTIEHKKVNQTDFHGQIIQKWACFYFWALHWPFLCSW